MTRTISFTLNGEQVSAEIKPHHNLVEVLQHEFNLMGARESCGQGMCGCCTVLVNGAAVSGCLYLAAFVEGADVQTVESLAALYLGNILYALERCALALEGEGKAEDAGFYRAIARKLADARGKEKR